MLEIAAQLHDVGKIGVPDAILLKPGKLDDAEFAIMRGIASTVSKSSLPIPRSVTPPTQAHRLPCRIAEIPPCSRWPPGSR